MYMYVYILTICAIRLYVFDLTIGHKDLVICVHVHVYLFFVNKFFFFFFLKRVN